MAGYLAIPIEVKLREDRHVFCDESISHSSFSRRMVSYLAPTSFFFFFAGIMGFHRNQKGKI